MSAKKNTVSLKTHFDALLRQRDMFTQRLIQKQDLDDARMEKLRDLYEDRLRISEQRAIDQAATWTQERLNTHNDLLNKWRDATEKDRGVFVSQDSFSALEKSFELHRDWVSKQFSMQEGKSKGFDAIKGAITFIAGLIVAGLTAYALYKAG